MTTCAHTLAGILEDHPATGAEPLLHSREETLTADAARHEAQSVADELRRAGVQRGQGVAVRMANDPRSITTMFGVWIAGAVFVPLNARTPEPELEHMLEQTRPAVLWSGGTLDAPCGSGGVRPGHRVRHVDIGNDRTAQARAAHARGLPRAARPRDRAPARRRTARTRGRPAPNLVPVSLALNAGIYNVLFGLRAGAEIVVMDRFDPADFAELVAALRNSLDRAAAGRDGDALRRPVDHRAHAAALCSQHHGAAVAATGPTLRRPVRRHRAQRLRAGRDRRGHRMDRGRRTGPSRQARRGRPRRIRGFTSASSTPTPAPGSADSSCGRRPRPRASIADRLDADGYVDTGDLARVDEDGFVWIEGRAGDVINRGGNKVFPEQVEEVIRLAPQVREAAVVGAPDDRLGEVPVAFVVAEDEVADDELFAALSRAPGAVQGACGDSPRRGAPAHRRRQGARAVRSSSCCDSYSAGRSRDGFAGGSLISAAAFAMRPRTQSIESCCIASCQPLITDWIASRPGTTPSTSTCSASSGVASTHSTPIVPLSSSRPSGLAHHVHLAGRLDPRNTAMRASPFIQSLPNSNSSDCRRRGSAL